MPAHCEVKELFHFHLELRHGSREEIARLVEMAARHIRLGSLNGIETASNGQIAGTWAIRRVRA